MNLNNLYYKSKNIFIKDFFPLLLLILFYIVITFVFFNKLQLDFNSYLEKYLLIEAFKNPYFLLVNLLFLILLILNKINFKNNVFYNKFFWENSKDGKLIKYFIFGCALIIAWYYITLDFNYFTNQAHYFERILLLLFLILLFFNPLYLIPFLSLLFIFFFQFEYPLAFSSTVTDKIQILILLMVSLSYVLLKNFNFKEIKIQKYHFLILSIVIVVSQYFYSGIAKIRISPIFYEWISNNNIFNLLMSSYSFGWLRSEYINIDFIINLTNYFSFLSSIGLFIFFLVQILAIFTFIKKKIMLSFLIEFTILHILIFLFSGIFFTKWIFLNLLLFLIIYNLTTKTSNEIFNTKNVIISIPLIIFSIVIFSSVSLGWFDSNYTNTYRIDLIGENGKTYEMSRNFITPYSTPFTQNRFYFLNNGTMTGTYGVTHNYELYSKLEKLKEKELNKTQTINEIKNLKNNYSQDTYDQKLVDDFDFFIKTYFYNFNSNNRELLISHLSYPDHILSYKTSNFDLYQNQENISEVRIVLEEKYFNGEEIILVNKSQIKNITIPSNQTNLNYTNYSQSNQRDIISRIIKAFKIMFSYF